jgi:hypothetical protein
LCLDERGAALQRKCPYGGHDVSKPFRLGSRRLAIC